ncbi:response regulator transcription factor [uncultured Arcticibacterium sp.]|uniref:response regulator transcription factor n=1 Tax=uncultured Arcticibacterium sp. TaxID=2173042 RepID=UPI0030F78B10
MQTLPKVLLIHRSTLICEVLRESLEQREYEVVSYATSGEDAFKKSTKYKPDVIIVSNSITDYSGLEIVNKLNRESFKGSFIFLSQNAKDARQVFQKLNVSGHIHTFDGMSELFFALQEIRAGRQYTSQSVKKEINKSYKEEIGELEMDTSVLKSLTPRELQIMQALSDSNTTPQIAKQFLISPATVNNHRANIMQKLNLRGRNQLIGVAISLKPFYDSDAA